MSNVDGERGGDKTSLGGVSWGGGQRASSRCSAYPRGRGGTIAVSKAFMRASLVGSGPLVERGCVSSVSVLSVLSGVLAAAGPDPECPKRSRLGTCR
jgi:hypothetical protein